MGAFSKIQFDSLRWISWWTDPNLGDICTAAAQNRKRGRGIFVTVFDLMKYFAGADFGEIYIGEKSRWGIYINWWNTTLIEV